MTDKKSTTHAGRRDELPCLFHEFVTFGPIINLTETRHTAAVRLTVLR